MKNLVIIVFGKNEEILHTLKRIIESTQGWQAIIQQDLSTCKTYLSANPGDILLLSSGLSTQEETEITDHLLRLNHTIGLIKHYGGGSGLLKNEIYSLFPDLIPGN
ncbi:MAG: hypothetical protein K0R59_3467 [Sphingobacterium sp.]|jgi:hypothetical protein|uniref:hypothetical protein n=1 Tax=unclassified Sphingobacterium TaxID=2609468 RepID=UPI00098529BC|nr:hypothetical protein [Sphingobacterium sp. CZ-UAM]MDF2518171.1 hypothetical protein [Sphingobacterium sp.]OOG17705.1 hypothetical protein BWD42_10305 [Sphingobacterium sp. CZ-UAM]